VDLLLGVEGRSTGTPPSLTRGNAPSVPSYLDKPDAELFAVFGGNPMLPIQERHSYEKNGRDLTSWLIANGVVSTFLATAIVAMAVLAGREFHSASAVAFKEATATAGNKAVTGAIRSNFDCRVMVAEAGPAAIATHAPAGRRCTSRYTRQVSDRKSRTKSG
jgi:hypothetical protein